MQKISISRNSHSFMKTSIISLLFIIITSTLSCQSKLIDCDKILDKVPYFVTHTVNAENDSILKDIKIFEECGQLDSIDFELLGGPMIGTIMVSQATEGKKITYRSILKVINEFKQTDDYKNLRDSKIIENKIINLSNWENDSQVFVNFGMSKSEIADFKKFVIMNSNKKMTFKQAFTNYTGSKQKNTTSKTESLQLKNSHSASLEHPKEHCPNDLPCFHDYDKALAYAKKVGKPLMLDFTGWACVSCRKMESQVWTDAEVDKRLRNDVVVVSLYVDDKTQLPESERTTKKLGDLDFKINTIGNKWSYMQANVYKTNAQPQYILIDHNEQMLTPKTTGYNPDIQNYIGWLDAGINEFKKRSGK